MAFDRADFITSAPSLNDCPAPDRPEICFAGRSNVGKSSLINSITGQKKLARTSNTPGKTQQMNYYLIDDKFYLVDLPGFGYAKVPEKERQRWARDIRHYLMKRETLRLTLHLVDARHVPGTLDEEFFFWMASQRKPFCVLLSKSDKLSGNKRQQAARNVESILSEMNIEVPVISCSTQSGRGIKEVRSLIREFTKSEPNV